MGDSLTHIVHVIYALRIGGLENGLVNLINRLPADRYRHTIICLTDYDDFSQRIERDGVAIHSLHKRDGNDFGIFIKLYRLFRKLRPDIVHTRNLATIEAQIPAQLAGVPLRIHGEHGRDRSDPDGLVKKYQWLRRGCALFIHRFVALSSELHLYLVERVGIAPERIERICNGVDTQSFVPAAKPLDLLPSNLNADSLIIGYVGRMDSVKDPLNLVQAFIALHQEKELSNVRLVMLGDGVERAAAMALLEKHGLSQFAWLPGSRSDVKELMRCFDVYVLPSIAEGISNTLLEAMATGLPTVATRVGGNAELVREGETAFLVDRQDSAQLVKAICRYVENESIRDRHAQAARERAVREFSLDAMVSKYHALYQSL